MDVRQLLQQGDVTGATALLRARLARKPGDVGAMFEFGQLLLAERKTRSAERLFRDVLEREPEHAGAHFFLAEALRAGNHIDDAEQYYRSAARLSAADPAPRHRLALMLHEAGRIDAAREAYEAALQLNPRLAQAHNNLAAILLGQQALDAALQHYVEALRIDPNLHEARLSLASIAERLGKLEVAADHYRAVLVKAPQHVVALRGLGGVLLAMRRFDRRTLAECEACWRGVLAAAADDVEANNNLGVVLGMQLRSAEAAVQFERAIRLGQKGKGGVGYVVDAAQVENYAMALSNSKQHVAALELLNQLHRHAPGNADVAFELLGTKLELCDWEGLREIGDRVASSGLARSTRKARPFPTLAIPSLTLRDHRDIARAYGETLHAASVAAVPPVVADAVDDDTRVLRVGYVSGDFRAHPMSYLVLGLLERHDRAQVRVFAYSSGRDDGSAWRRRAEAAPDVFRDVSELEDDEFAARVRDDAIDILVDLNGWANEGRLGAFAMRPAPVQAGWLGYPATVGVDGIYDYVIGDAVVTPLADAPFYVETIAQLPNSYQANDDARGLGTKPPRSALALPEEAVVLCCFNQLYKLNPGVLDAWCRILTAVPNSVLWLLEAKDPHARTNLEKEFAARGVPLSRLAWAPRLPVEEHLARLQQADIGLDTWPYNAHTTAADALWAGVPMTTLRGNTFAGRVCESLLRAFGMAEMVADDVDAYVDMVVALATDSAALRAARAKVKGRRKASPLFDTTRFAADLERLYRRMWLQRNAPERAPIVLDKA